MTTPTFKLLRAQGDSHGEHDDCAVIAVAVVTGMPYDRVHAVLEELGRRKGGRTMPYTTEKALERLGFQITAEDHRPGRLYGGKVIGFSTKSIERVSSYQEGSWLVNTRTHLAGMTDGVLHDYSRDKKMRIVYMMKIEPRK